MSPTFTVSAAELRRRLNDLISSMSRTRVLYGDDADILFEERSAVFGFPDYIDIRMIEIDANTSTLAIYSRSKFGYYDFGVNERRVEALLRNLVPAEAT